MRRQCRKATEDEKVGIDCLQVEVKERLAMLRRAKNIRKRRERARLAFSKDLFKFVKSLFDWKKCGSLLVPKEKLEEHLEEVYKHQERFRELVLRLEGPRHPRHLMECPAGWIRRHQMC